MSEREREDAVFRTYKRIDWVGDSASDIKCFDLSLFYICIDEKENNIYIQYSNLCATDTFHFLIETWNFYLLCFYTLTNQLHFRMSHEFMNTL